MYKYEVEDYEYIAEDLQRFYDALEVYKDEKTERNRNRVVNELQKFFLILKGYRVLGFISPVEFEEMLDYLQDLIDA